MTSNIIKFILISVGILAFSGCEVWDQGEHPQSRAVKQIVAFADSNKSDVPDFKVYERAGVTIDSADVNRSNGYIRTLSGSDVDTTEKIQDIVDNIDALTAPENVKPTAKISVNKDTVKEGEAIFFDAIDSNDSDGEIIKYEWKEDGKVLATGIAYDAVLSVDRHIIELIVTDDDGGIGTDKISVIVENVVVEPSPVPTTTPSNKTPKAIIEVTETNTSFIFDASGSTDSDGSISSYLWQEKLTDLSKASKFIYDKNVSKGEHIISLTVKDNKGLVGTPTKTITIK